MFEVLGQQIEKLQVIRSALQDLRLEGLKFELEDVIDELSEILDIIEEDEKWTNQ